MNYRFCTEKCKGDGSSLKPYSWSGALEAFLEIINTIPIAIEDASMDEPP
jgi:hypothetical protein